MRGKKWSIRSLATPRLERLAESFDLEDDEDREVIAELFDHLIHEGPKRLGALFAAADEGRHAEVEKIAHELKSTLGNLGFLDASSLCAEVMQACRDSRDDDAIDDLGELRGAAELLVDTARKVRKGL